MIPTSLLALFLVACSLAIPKTQEELQSKPELSWEEKTIARYFDFEEKNLDLSMEELIKKKEACYEYARDLYGKEAEMIGNRVYRHEYIYSPRFDRCFTKRHISGGGQEQQTLIFDVLSEKVMFGRNEDCMKNINKEIYTIKEIKERCPSDGDVSLLWDALANKRTK